MDSIPSQRRRTLNTSNTLNSAWGRCACITTLVYVVLLIGGCGGGTNVPDEPTHLIPDDWDGMVVHDVSRILGGDTPKEYVDGFDREGVPAFETLGVYPEDISTLVTAVMPDGSRLSIMKGDFDFEGVRDELFDAGMDEDEYRGWELWTGGRGEWAKSVAVLEDDDYLIIGPRETAGPIDVLRGLGRESGLVAYDEDGHVDELLERVGEGWHVGMSSKQDCWGVNIRGCEAVAVSIRTGDEYDFVFTWVYAFRDERSARAAHDNLQDRFDRIEAFDIQNVREDGPYIVVEGTLDEDDWSADAWRWPAMASAPEPSTAPAISVAPAPAPTPASPLAPAGRSTSAAAPAPATVPPPVTGAAPAQPAPTIVPPPTPAPQPAPAPPTPVPTEVPTATPVPLFSGTLGIAMNYVGRANGLPRFCGPGCSDEIHISGLTDTLFSAVRAPDGTITTEPMLATTFNLDPSLDFATISLRKGMQFHRGWGEMTARDVAHSLNDANLSINPDSTHRHSRAFADVMASVEALDDHTVRINHHSFDSRGPLRLFSGFLNTAGIMSRDVFDQYGVEGTQDIYVGVGPFMTRDENHLDAWVENSVIYLRANPDYYGIDEGLGPFVEHVWWAQAPEVTTRMAMLETGEADIAEIDVTRYSQIESLGFKLKDDGALGMTHSISWAGNYWESHSRLTGEALDRERDTGRPWVGDPFENGDTYDESTDSMLRSQKVREALSWAVDRQAIVDKFLDGYGSVNHQPGLSARNPNYREEWSWGTDYQRSAQLLAEAGYPDGFEMDLRVRGYSLTGQIAGVLSRDWSEHLGVTVSLDRSDYSAYQDGLEDRTANTVGFGCTEQNGIAFPYDWAPGLSLSSLSAGQPGAGQELPYATEVYSSMIGEPDRSARRGLAAHFYSENRRLANCTGLIEIPVWPAYNPETVAEWTIRPTAIINMGAINNIRSVRMR